MPTSIILPGWSITACFQAPCRAANFFSQYLISLWHDLRAIFEVINRKWSDSHRPVRVGLFWVRNRGVWAGRWGELFQASPSVLVEEGGGTQARGFLLGGSLPQGSRFLILMPLSAPNWALRGSGSSCPSPQCFSGYALSPTALTPSCDMLKPPRFMSPGCSGLGYSIAWRTFPPRCPRGALNSICWKPKSVSSSLVPRASFLSLWMRQHLPGTPREKQGGILSALPLSPTKHRPLAVLFPEPLCVCPSSPSSLFWLLAGS